MPTRTIRSLRSSNRSAALITGPTCSGAASTFFGFHPTAKLGVLVYGAHWDCFGGKGASKGVRGTTRLCGFRDAINAAFQLQRQA